MPLDMVDNLRIVRVNQANIPQAQSIFFHAYQDNPLLRYFLNATRNGFEQRLRGFIRAQLSAHYRGNNSALAIADGQRLVGAMMINKTRQPGEISSSWSWRLAMYSVAGVYYTEQLRNYYHELSNRLSGHSCYWISLAGLHPDYQHQGFGHRLMRAAAEECYSKNRFTPLCMDISSDEQQHFFKSLGYQSIAELQRTGLNIEIMLLQDLKAKTVNSDSTGQSESNK